MKWETLYEISKYALPLEPMLLGSIVIVIIVVSMIIEYKDSSATRKQKLMNLFLPGFMVIMMVLLFAISIAEVRNTAYNYYAGNYVVYEGEIQSYEKVKIDRIHFEIGEESFDWPGIIGQNKLPSKGYIRVYMSGEDIVRIDKRIEEQ